MGGFAKVETWPPGDAGGRRWPELDFLRGVAVLMVVFAHMHFPEHTAVDGPIWFVKSYGAFGVDLFFVLSGFLIGGLLFQDLRATGKVDIGRFYVRRALKILPPLYALLLFHLVTHRHPASTFLWQNLLMVPNYLGSSIAQTWTLGVEEHFYLGLAALMVLFAALKLPLKWTLISLGAIAFAACAGRWVAVFGFQQIDIALTHTEFRIDTLLVGVMLAALFWMDRPRFDALRSRRGLLIVLALGCFGVGGVCFLWTPAMRTLGFMGMGLGWAAVLLLTFNPGLARPRGVLFRLIAQVGVYSYGIYLWHTLMQAPAEILIAKFAIRGIDPTLTAFAVAALQLAVAVVSGVIATRLVEWPVLKLREVFFPRVASRGPAAPQTSAIEPAAESA